MLLSFASLHVISMGAIFLSQILPILSSLFHFLSHFSLFLACLISSVCLAAGILIQVLLQSTNRVQPLSSSRYSGSHIRWSMEMDEQVPRCCLPPIHPTFVMCWIQQQIYVYYIKSLITYILIWGIQVSFRPCTLFSFTLSCINSGLVLCVIIYNSRFKDCSVHATCCSSSS